MNDPRELAGVSPDEREFATAVAVDSPSAAPGRLESGALRRTPSTESVSRQSEPLTPRLGAGVARHGAADDLELVGPERDGPQSECGPVARSWQVHGILLPPDEICGRAVGLAAPGPDCEIESLRATGSYKGELKCEPQPGEPIRTLVEEELTIEVETKPDSAKQGVKWEVTGPTGSTVTSIGSPYVLNLKRGGEYEVKVYCTAMDKEPTCEFVVIAHELQLNRRRDFWPAGSTLIAGGERMLQARLQPEYLEAKIVWELVGLGGTMGQPTQRNEGDATLSEAPLDAGTATGLGCVKCRVEIGTAKAEVSRELRIVAPERGVPGDGHYTEGTITVDRQGFSLRNETEIKRARGEVRTVLDKWLPIHVVDHRCKEFNADLGRPARHLYISETPHLLWGPGTESEHLGRNIETWLPSTNTLPKWVPLLHTIIDHHEFRLPMAVLLAAPVGGAVVTVDDWYWRAHVATQRLKPEEVIAKTKSTTYTLIGPMTLTITKVSESSDEIQLAYRLTIPAEQEEPCEPMEEAEKPCGESN